MLKVKQALLMCALALTMGAAYAQGAADGRELDPKMRAKIEAEWRAKAGKDGYITKQQFMQAMEGHWHNFEKRHSHAGRVKPEDMPRLMMFLSGQDTSP